METAELDTTQEEASPNGHDDTWQSFENDLDFVQHILSKKPAERLVEVPEWNVKILCKALNADHRIKVQMEAYDEKSKRTDFRTVFHLVVMGGCYNPNSGNLVFSEKHRTALMQQQDGGAVERLAITILRLSRMLPEDTENAKKN